jgi:UDP-N-acetylglucosamine transferase subunit ALG13
MLGAGAVIFVSVGSMLPFDRLVRAVDAWAAAHPGTPVFAQIGEGEFQPAHCEWTRMLAHDEYSRRLDACRLFVAHVGMGSILQAMERQKQALLMPRLAAQREHTTDHQLHTAEKFGSRPGIRIVSDGDALQAEMTRLLDRPLEGSAALSPFAPPTTTDRLRSYLLAQVPAARR